MWDVRPRLVLCCRFRCICMVFVFAAGAIIWQNRQFLSTYTGSVLPLSQSGAWHYDFTVLLSVTGVFWLCVTSSHMHKDLTLNFSPKLVAVALSQLAFVNPLPEEYRFVGNLFCLKLLMYGESCSSLEVSVAIMNVCERLHAADSLDVYVNRCI